MKRWIAALFTGCLALLFITCFTSPAFSESKTFQASLTPRIAVHDRDIKIKGVSLGIWSENPQQSLTLGFVSESTGKSSGISLSFLVNYADSYTGFHWAPVNFTTENFVGWQNGIVNYTDRHFKGFQSAVVNYAGNMTGLQLGMVNFADTVDRCLQLGLVNVISENRWFRDLPDSLAPGMILLNWRF